jgi:DNA polymerase II
VGLNSPLTMASLRGFVLQPTYELEAGRPVVLLYGKLEDGRSFLLRDDREVPHFYVLADDVTKARALGAGPLSPSGQVTMEGRPVARVEVVAPSDAPPLRERLRRGGIACYEADVRFAMRYLIDRGIRGSLSIDGEGQPRNGIGIVFDNPKVAPADWTPRLSVLSFDIETDPQARRLLSIGLHGCGASEVLLVNARDQDPAGAVPFATEKELLIAFARRVRELDPDILTGWNVVDFDLAVLLRIATRERVRLELGRGQGALRVRTDRSPRGSRQANVPGRVVLDGILLLRSSFFRMDDYSLDAVARDVLGEGKTVAGHGRADEILRLFQEDRVRLVEYNRTDARLALEILEKRQLVDLAVARSRLTGLPIDRVSSSIAAFDSLYLAELARRHIVAPSVDGAAEVEPTGGGHVLEPKTGLHQNVLVFDFRSLYPSLIRTFEIDPWNLLRADSPAAENEHDPIRAPNGAAFGRRKGILPSILDELLPLREEAVRAGDGVKGQAIKILMNSFYGVLGTTACRFYDPRLANAITSFGREVLLWCKGRLEDAGRLVLYGDTDSLFVLSGDADPLVARRLGEEIARSLGRELADHIRRTWRVESRLDLRFERLYLRLFLPAVRHGTAGARKRYVGLVDDGRVAFTGMEAVRGDWTPLARELQRELYGRLFSDRPVDEYLRALVADLRGGLLDGQLVYTKSLRKAPEAYTATTPPHVAAARKVVGGAGRRIAYVVTRDGPEPADARKSPFDHEHYVQKQVRPVAEPVLALLGLDFAQVIGDRRQLSLF